MVTTSSALSGTPVVPGIVHAPVHQVRADIDPAALDALESRDPDQPENDLADYDEAATAVADGYARRAQSASGAAASVLSASAGLARDKGLRVAVEKQLRSGEGLAASVRAAVDQFTTLFSGMGGLMAERVTDLRDIERRVLAHLAGVPEPGVDLPEHPCVLVAADLAPSDTAALDPAVVAALITERGGPTSHTAIIARQLAIPCLVGVAGATDIADGALVLVDGQAGTVDLHPGPDAAARAETDLARRQAVASWTGPGRTSDGHRVELLANVADGTSARDAAAGQVEGVGLFRTELCFLDRREEPTVAEQAEIYAEVLAPFAGRGHVVVRTLDAGSDKPIAFATHEGEENPALGVRGLRLAADNPGLLERQLDAIAVAAERTGTDTWVMAPMVATVQEAADFADLVRARGLKPGVMVEVPAAALMAHRLLDVVDFLSIGTNDLTQYAMAADRLATDLAHLTDPWHSAVLQLIAITAEAGRHAGKPVGICGEAAADAMLAPVLVGLGVTSLSMAPAAVPAVGARLGAVTAGLCESAAEAALGALSPLQGREAVANLLG